MAAGGGGGGGGWGRDNGVRNKLNEASRRKHEYHKGIFGDPRVI